MFSHRLIRSFTFAIFAGMLLVPTTARAEVILLGSDYLVTVGPTSFEGLGELKGLPFGPGNTDTVVQRQDNCRLDLSINGSSCTLDMVVVEIPIELVALSLQSTTNPLVQVRESPTLESRGSMTIVSDGSGFGGTFTSFFDVFFEISMDGGQSWEPQPLPLSLETPTTKPGKWTIIEPLAPAVLVDGPVGDQAANRHTNKEVCPALFGDICFDFYILGVVEERHPGQGVHSARQAQLVDCDIDSDGDVDRNDINLILAARNMAAAPGDLLDVDGDGGISVRDAKICSLLCTRLRCAP